VFGCSEHVFNGELFWVRPIDMLIERIEKRNDRDRAGKQHRRRLDAIAIELPHGWCRRRRRFESVTSLLALPATRPPGFGIQESHPIAYERRPT